MVPYEFAKLVAGATLLLLAAFFILLTPLWILGAAFGVLGL
jgi:hypothetical protein